MTECYHCHLDVDGVKGHDDACPVPSLIMRAMPVGEWFVDHEGCPRINGTHCYVWMQARPGHCDRGRWLAHVEVTTRNHEVYIDHQDGWPRYYFDLERAKAEVEAWLRVRRQLP